jgi:hypothetical protein
MHENGFAVLRCGSQSALVRSASTANGCCSPTPPEAWGLRARSKEQRFALELLLDPTSAWSPSTAAPAPARPCSRSPPASSRSSRQRAYEKLAVYRPLVPVGRADVGFLPGGLDEKLDPWMSAIHDAIVALTDQRSATTPTPHGRRAHHAQPAVARVGDVPARPQPAPPDRDGRRGAEPRADDAEDGAHAHRRGHEGHLHRRHQPDRCARTSASRTTRWRC